MSEDSATREASPSPRHPDRRALALAGWEAAAFVLTAAAVAGFGAYGWRREIGRTLAEEWLREQGVQSAVMIDGLSATGFSGRLRVGPAENPIVAADRIEVDLAFSPPWSGEPFKLEARAVRLVRPRVRMAFDGRKVSFGALDPLIDMHEPHATIKPGKKGYSIALRTGPNMSECERIIGSIEHFYGHLEIESVGHLGLTSIEYKVDVESRKQEIFDFCKCI